MATKLAVSTYSMLRLFTDNLHMRAYHWLVGQCLSPNLKICHKRAEQLLHWHATNVHENILFIDKIFTVEVHSNKQNDKIYARSSQKANEKVPRVQRERTTPLQWWCGGCLPPWVHETSFLWARCQDKYQSLSERHNRGIMKLLNMMLFKGRLWCLSTRIHPHSQGQQHLGMAPRQHPDLHHNRRLALWQPGPESPLPQVMDRRRRHGLL